MVAGFGADDRRGPNYAGWARKWIQAGRPIPMGWSRAFWGELAGADADGFAEYQNEAYAEGLRRDVATFGIRFVYPSGDVVEGAEVRR